MLRNASVNTQLTLFGHFSLSQGGDTFTQFSYDKVKALLVHLLHGQPVNPGSTGAL